MALREFCVKKTRVIYDTYIFFFFYCHAFLNAQGEQGLPGPPGPPGPPGELPLLPPELAGFQQSALARWRRELQLLNDVNADDDGGGRTDPTTTTTKTDDSGGNGPGLGDDGPKYVDIVSSIYGMRQDLERIRKPVGTRENPVMTCKDLFYGHPQFKDGNSATAAVHRRAGAGGSATFP